MTTTPDPSAFPPLPKVGPICYASAVDVVAYKPAPEVGTHLPGVRDVALWSTDQMRAYVLADRAARRASPVEPSGVSGGLPPGTLWLLEWGAISLPMGHESRITCAEVHPTRASAEQAAEGLEFDHRIVPDHAERRQTLINALVASKSWMRGYAEAFVDDMLDAEVSQLRSGIAALLKVRDGYGWCKESDDAIEALRALVPTGKEAA